MKELEKCEISDGPCLQNMGDSMMKWMAHGRPDYFIEAIDPMFFNEWKLMIHDEEYTLQGINVTGASETTNEYVE